MFNDDKEYGQGMEGRQESQQGSEDSTYRMTFTEEEKEEYNEEPPRKEKKTRRARTERGRRWRHPFAAAIGCAVICGVIIGACVIGSFAIGRNSFGQASNPVTVTTNSDNLASLDTTDAETTAATGTYTVAQIAEQCGSSVVAITNRGVQEVLTMFGYFEEESEGSGSGVIIGLNDDELLIVTNYHVVEGADELTVCFFDSEDAVYAAQIKGTDENNDLAVVAIPTSDISEDVLNAISIATIGDSDSLQVGDGVVAIGNALGLGTSVTSGIISAVDREVYIDDYTANLLQTDAAINPGNSGGALFNMRGELVGINSAKYASEEIEGMGFAIPMATAQPIIENLVSQQTRTRLEKNYGCLNITGTDVSSEAAQSYGMPVGVYVSEVLEGAAADNAGIKAGDIITGLDGTNITGIEQLRDRLQYYKAGETVEVTLSRNNGNGYEEMTVEVKLDNASQQDSSNFSDATESDEGTDGEDGDYYYYYGDDGNGNIEDFFNQFGSFFGQ